MKNFYLFLFIQNFSCNLPSNVELTADTTGIEQFIDFFIVEKYLDTAAVLTGLFRVM